MKALRTFVFLGVLFLSTALVCRPGGGAESPGPTLHEVQVAGVINPVVAEFVADRIEVANGAGAAGFLLQLDTPGGLDTAMRQIIQAQLGSTIPVIVYVAPSGARAASAGALITLAGDFAAMAPGTNIGAAHPVAIGPGGGGQQDETMTTKLVNDAVAYARSIAAQRGRNEDWAEKVVRESISITAEEAVAEGVVDLVAGDREELLAALDGRTYRRGEEERTLRSSGARVVTTQMGWRQQILDTLSDPTVAYLLMMLGIVGIFFEISQPGAIFPGAIGAIAILLALFAFQALPVNFAGVLLIILALVLFLLEVKVTSFGMLTVGGIVAMALGSLMLIDSSAPYLQISREVILATVAVCSGFFILVLFYVVRTQRSRFVSGAEGMVGEQGTAVAAFVGVGKVFVHGEYWHALSREPVEAGDPVEVVTVEPGMRLVVKKVRDFQEKGG